MLRFLVSKINIYKHKIKIISLIREIKIFINPDQSIPINLINPDQSGSHPI